MNLARNKLCSVNPWIVPSPIAFCSIFGQSRQSMDCPFKAIHALSGESVGCPNSHFELDVYRERERGGVCEIVLFKKLLKAY